MKKNPPADLMSKTLTAFNRLLLILLVTASAVYAQSTAFTYQGRLTDGGAPASATYDMQFLLFDTPDVGTGEQQGETITNPTVQVANGVFSVQLDFGAAVFNGPPRYLEIGVRPVGSNDPYTTLSPRQPISTIPYSINSMNAATADGLSVSCVNCITSSQIQSVEGAQISGEIPVESVPLGSGNYIQNSVAAAARLKRPAAAQEGGFDLTGDGMLGGNLIVNGQTGLGTATPLAGITLDVVGPTRIAPGGSGGVVQFGPAGGETGMGIIGGNRADVRFDGFALKLIAGLNTGAPPSTNGIAIDTAGNVGVGTTTPMLGIKLDVVGPTRIAPGGSGGVVQFGPAAGETGMAIVGTNRADVRFDGTTLKLVAGMATGAPPSTFGIAIHTSGNVGIGTTNPTAKFQVVGTAKVNVLEVAGSDVAERFEIGEAVKAGMVVAIDPLSAGKLSVARGAYNRRVAGIISGANNLSAGMILPDAAGAKKSMPVALTGRVWVYCDATRHAVNPGDLLTTSSIPGHAMKVMNYSRAQGAIIGKAMTGLKAGRGLVLVLVTLQ